MWPDAIASGLFYFIKQYVHIFDVNKAMTTQMISLRFLSQLPV